MNNQRRLIRLQRSGLRALNDVKDFVRAIRNEKTLFHPDDRFETYQVADRAVPAYTRRAARLRNALNEACFRVCARKRIDYAEFGMETFYEMENDGSSRRW